MLWQRWTFRNQKVFARVDAPDQLHIEANRVEIHYRMGDGRVYKVLPSSLLPLSKDDPSHQVVEDEGPGETEATLPDQAPRPTPAAAAPPLPRPAPVSASEAATAPSAKPSSSPSAKPSSSPSAANRPAKKAHSGKDDSDDDEPSYLRFKKRPFYGEGGLPVSDALKPIPGNEKPPIIIYTDGACSGNPGPAGLGVVLLCAGHRRELSEYLGKATSNIAELTAILRGLERVKDRSRLVVIHSDSQYSLGVLGLSWKVNKNQELVSQIVQQMEAFPHLRLVKVAGHAGIPENERCDALARAAITRKGTVEE